MQEVEGQEEKDRTFHLGEKTAPNVSLEVRRADSEESHPQIPSEWRNIRQPTDGTTRRPCLVRSSNLVLTGRTVPAVFLLKESTLQFLAKNTSKMAMTASGRSG